MVNVIIVENLGNEFDLGNIEAGKIHLLTDGSIVRNTTTGELSVDVSALGITNTLSLAGTTLISTVNGTVANQDLLSAIQTGETVTALSYNATTTELSYTDEDGVVSTIDLSALTTDIYVDGATFNAGTSVLTLTDNDGGTGDIVIDLSAFVVSITDNGDGTYDIVQNGATVGTIDTKDGVSADAGQALTLGSDGLPYLDAASLASDSVVDNGDGTFTHTAVDGTVVTFDAKLGVSADAGNLLVNGSDVLPFVDASAIRTLADVEVQDAFGVTLYYSFSTNA